MLLKETACTVATAHAAQRPPVPYGTVAAAVVVVIVVGGGGSGSGGVNRFADCGWLTPRAETH